MSAANSETTKSGETKTGTESISVESISVESILARIDKIISDTGYLQETIRSLNQLSPSPESSEPYAPGDIAGQAKAEALSDVVKCRETTNQQILRFLEKMYDDIKPKELSSDMLKLKQLAEILSIYPPDSALDIIRRSAQQMFVHAGAEVVH